MLFLTATLDDPLFEQPSADATDEINIFYEGYNDQANVKTQESCSQLCIDTLWCAAFVSKPAKDGFQTCYFFTEDNVPGVEDVSEKGELKSLRANIYE